MIPTYFELFAGAGGLSYGLDMAGWRCVGHAEWEDFPRRVLTARWPGLPLFGDVSKLTGAEILACNGGAPPTLLSGGSPCQDISHAGKRRGMEKGSGTRSSLFHEQIRLWEECQSPYLLWENVLGALSSNKGRDFARVLSAFVGSPVDVPARGWRGGGGVVCGRGGVAAWRVLDAQFFGVPQRRRRVFVLGARAGGVDPAEVLSLAESLSGDTQAGREAREGIAAAVGASPEGGIAINNDSRAAADYVAASLRSGHRAQQSVLAFHQKQDPINGAVSPSLGLSSDGMGVLAFEAKGSQVAADSIAPPLRSMNTDNSHVSGGGHVGVPAFDTTQVTSKANRSNPQVGDPCHPLAAGAKPPLLVYDARGNGDGSVVSTLPGDHLNRITDYTPVVMASGQANAELVRDGEPSLTTQHDGPPIVFPAYTSGAHPGSYNGMDAVPQAAARIAAAPMVGRPRRLMPIECERLMGWPDFWTDIPDEKGKPASDSVRYKACGNGVASPVAAWIGMRLKEALDAFARGRQGEMSDLAIVEDSPGGLDSRPTAEANA